MAYCQSDYDATLKALYRDTVPLMGADSLARSMDGEGVYLLDTRSKEEYDVSHIRGALFIDYDRFAPEDVQHIPRDARVVLYCSVGYRSERIGEKMLEMGFKEVYNLYGGIFEWKNRDRHVVNRLDQPTDSVHAYDRVWSVWLRKGIKVY